jgi:hypothetical protein
MLLIWWLRSTVLILSTSWVMSWHRWLRKFFLGGKFHMLADYNFTWITGESTFQRSLSNLSLKTILEVCLTHLIVLILYHRTSGFRSCEDFARRPDLWRARTVAGGNHRVFEWNLAARSSRGFEPLGREGVMGFRKQWRLLSRVNPSFRKTFFDSPDWALAPLLIDCPLLCLLWEQFGCLGWLCSTSGGNRPGDMMKFFNRPRSCSALTAGRDMILKLFDCLQIESGYVTFAARDNPGNSE